MSNFSRVEVFDTRNDLIKVDPGFFFVEFGFLEKFKTGFNDWEIHSLHVGIK